MRKALKGLILILATAATLRAEEPAGPPRFEQAFQAGGKVTIRLSSGKYEVVAGPGDKIIVTLESGPEKQLPKVKVRIQANGASDARVEVKDTPRNNNFLCRIQVPARTDLHIRLSAGELQVEGIEGNKDISMRAGELKVDVGDPSDYSRVEASVWTGEVAAQPFRADKEGLFRSFHHDGRGAYRLRARLRAGEITLYSRMARATH